MNKNIGFKPIQKLVPTVSVGNPSRMLKLNTLKAKANEISSSAFDSITDTLRRNMVEPSAETVYPIIEDRYNSLFERIKHHIVDIIDETRALIPSANCKGLCQHECSALPIHRAELRLMSAAQKQGKYNLPVIDNGHCSWLTEEGGCANYADRPLVCRLFYTVYPYDPDFGGAEPFVACPHGCEPGNWLSAKETAAILEIYDDLSMGLTKYATIFEAYVPDNLILAHSQHMELVNKLNAAASDLMGFEPNPDGTINLPKEVYEMVGVGEDEDLVIVFSSPSDYGFVMYTKASKEENRRRRPS